MSCECDEPVTGSSGTPQLGAKNRDTKFTNLDINACKEIWWFLSQYRMDELMEINENAENIQPLKVYPNPATNLLHVEWDAIQPNSVALFDLMGRCVLTSSRQIIDVSGLSAGTYLIKASGIETTRTALFTKADN